MAHELFSSSANGIPIKNKKKLHKSVTLRPRNFMKTVKTWNSKVRLKHFKATEFTGPPFGLCIDFVLRLRMVLFFHFHFRQKRGPFPAKMKVPCSELRQVTAKSRSWRCLEGKQSSWGIRIRTSELDAFELISFNLYSSNLTHVFMIVTFTYICLHDHNTSSTVQKCTRDAFHSFAWGQKCCSRKPNSRYRIQVAGPTGGAWILQPNA